MNNEKRAFLAEKARQIRVDAVKAVHAAKSGHPGGAAANRLLKESAGFCGYDWMISSIIRNGYIISPSEEKQKN